MAEGKEESKSSKESVKLFVGQVPKHMTEAELLAMFKEFALVDEVNIIKDKTTRASREKRLMRQSMRAIILTEHGNGEPDWTAENGGRTPMRCVRDASARASEEVTGRGLLRHCGYG
ncbi:RNA-binding domain superfamily [Sesbania bispinosa]|nr:RNA-binding domain superfamily [Sesbania bispinosa]